jgi:hypothetical protein
VPDEQIVVPVEGEFKFDDGEKVVTEKFWQNHYLALIN